MNHIKKIFLAVIKRFQVARGEGLGIFRSYRKLCVTELIKYGLATALKSSNDIVNEFVSRKYYESISFTVGEKIGWNNLFEFKFYAVLNVKPRKTGLEK